MGDLDSKGFIGSIGFKDFVRVGEGWGRFRGGIWRLEEVYRSYFK